MFLADIFLRTLGVGCDAQSCQQRCQTSDKFSEQATKTDGLGNRDMTEERNETECGMFIHFSQEYMSLESFYSLF